MATETNEFELGTNVSSALHEWRPGQWHADALHAAPAGGAVTTKRNVPDACSKHHRRASRVASPNIPTCVLPAERRIGAVWRRVW